MLQTFARSSSIHFQMFCAYITTSAVTIEKPLHCKFSLIQKFTSSEIIMNVLIMKNENKEKLADETNFYYNPLFSLSLWESFMNNGTAAAMPEMFRKQLCMRIFQEKHVHKIQNVDTHTLCMYVKCLRKNLCSTMFLAKVQSGNLNETERIVRGEDEKWRERRRTRYEK